MRLLLIALPLLLSLQSPVFAQQDSNDVEMISFDVFLDKKQVGTHIFDIQRKDEKLLVKSNMQLRGKFWGLVPFKYTHQSTEEWKDGCLISLESQTLKRGKNINISASTDLSGLTIISGDKAEVVQGCTKSFAYWDNSRLMADQLLNTENGKLVDVEIETINSQSGEGKSLIIRSSEADIKLEYAADGKWLSLKSKLEVGGMLHYIRQ